MTALEYEIRVEGLVTPAVLEEFEGVHVQVHPTVTVLRGPVIDQAALHGLLNRLQSLDPELIGVRRLDSARDPHNE